MCLHKKRTQPDWYTYALCSSNPYHISNHMQQHIRNKNGSHITSQITYNNTSGTKKTDLISHLKSHAGAQHLHDVDLNLDAGPHEWFLSMVTAIQYGRGLGASSRMSTLAVGRASRHGCLKIIQDQIQILILAPRSTRTRAAAPVETATEAAVLSTSTYTMWTSIWT